MECLAQGSRAEMSLQSRAKLLSCDRVPGRPFSRGAIDDVADDLLDLRVVLTGVRTWTAVERPASTLALLPCHKPQY